MTDFPQDEGSIIFDITQEEFLLPDKTTVTSLSPPPAFVRVLNETSFVKEDADLNVVECDGTTRVTMALLQYLLFTNSKPYTTTHAEDFHEKTFGRAFLGYNKWQWLPMTQANEYIKKIKGAPFRKLWVTRKNLRKRKKEHPKKGVQYLSSIPLHLAYRFLWFLSTCKDATPGTATFWQLVQLQAKKDEDESNSEIDRSTMESQDFQIRELQRKLMKHENVGVAVAFDNLQPAERAAPRLSVQQLPLQKQQIVSQQITPDLQQRRVDNAMQMREQNAKNCERMLNSALSAMQTLNQQVMEMYEKETRERERPSKRSRSPETEFADIED